MISGHRRHGTVAHRVARSHDAVNRQAPGAAASAVAFLHSFTTSSPRGAVASATLYSLIKTAKANGREPYWYLRELFEKLPHARTRADHLSLLPTARPPPPAS